MPFWAPGVFAFFGFSRYLGGLRLLAPLLRPFSRTRGGKGASLLLVPCFVFPLFVLFCGFTRSPSRLSSRSGQPVLTPSRAPGSPSPPLGRVIPRGALLARRVGPLHFWDFDGLFGSHRVTGTPRAFLSGEGALYLPPQALFRTHLCLFPRPRFFPAPYCHTLSGRFFPLLEGGNAVGQKRHIFSSCVFVWFGVILSQFFSVLLVLGKSFFDCRERGNFCFWAPSGWSLGFHSVLPCVCSIFF